MNGLRLSNHEKLCRAWNRLRSWPWNNWVYLRRPGWTSSENCSAYCCRLTEKWMQSATSFNWMANGCFRAWTGTTKASLASVPSRTGFSITAAFRSRMMTSQVSKQFLMAQVTTAFRELGSSRQSRSLQTTKRALIWELASRLLHRRTRLPNLPQWGRTKWALLILTKKPL